MKKKFLLITLSSLFFSFCAILLFTHGYLRVREVIKEKSDKTPPIFVNGEIESANETVSWFPQTSRKVIFLLVDALKWDFAYYNESLQAKDELNYQNKLPYLHQLLKEQPQNSLLMKSYADPPTLTAARLKSTMSGSLPSYTEIKNNFNADANPEDNLIAQMKESGKKTVFMGDNTWTNLYPDMFDETYAFKSFNINDIDDVDTRFLGNLDVSLKRGNWTFLAAHFLMVDHTGHVLGQDNEKMKQILGRMNGILQNVTKLMDNDTVLFIVGDHGMVPDGSHGGNSRGETDAATFVYSKTPLNIYSSTFGFDSQRILNIDQIDLAATLSYLINVPIPHNNLGSIIPSLACGLRQKSNFSLQNCQLEIVDSLMINVAQIKKNLDIVHNKTLLFSKDQVKELSASIESFVQNGTAVRQQILNPKAAKDQVNQAVNEFIAEFQSLTKETLKLTRDNWGQSSFVAMTEGNILIVLSIVAMVIIHYAFPSIQKRGIQVLDISLFNSLDYKFILRAVAIIVGLVVMLIVGASVDEWLGFVAIIGLIAIITIFYSWNNKDEELVSPTLEASNIQENNKWYHIPEKYLLPLALLTHCWIVYSSFAVGVMLNLDYLLFGLMTLWLGYTLITRGEFKTLGFAILGLLCLFVGDSHCLKELKRVNPDDPKPMWITDIVAPVWDSKFFYILCPAALMFVYHLRKILRIGVDKYPLAKYLNRLSEIALIVYFTLGGWEANSDVNTYLACSILVSNILQFVLITWVWRKDEKLLNPFDFTKAFKETMMIFVGKYSLIIFPVVSLLISKVFSTLLAKGSSKNIMTYAVVTALLGYFLFWTTGHRQDFGTINVTSGFIFTTAFNILLTGFCAFMNTFGIQIWLFFYALYQIYKRGPYPQLTSDLWNTTIVWEINALCVFFGSAINSLVRYGDFLSVMIFAPKYVFDAVNVIGLVIAIAVARMTLVMVIIKKENNKNNNSEEEEAVFNV